MFLKVLRQVDVAQVDLSIAGWLFTVARTVLTDHRGDEYRYGPVAMLNENLTDRTGASSTSHDEKVRRVNEVLALPSVGTHDLPRSSRGGETAGALGFNHGNVKVIRHRALAREANLMEEGASTRLSSDPVRRRLHEDRWEYSSDIAAQSAVFPTLPACAGQQGAPNPWAGRRVGQYTMPGSGRLGNDIT